jgi:hypothetical protein
MRIGLIKFEREWGSTIDRTAELAVKTIENNGKPLYHRHLQTKNSIRNWERQLPLIENNNSMEFYFT